MIQRAKESFVDPNYHISNKVAGHIVSDDTFLTNLVLLRRCTFNNMTNSVSSVYIDIINQKTKNDLKKVEWLKNEVIDRTLYRKFRFDISSMTMSELEKLLQPLADELDINIHLYYISHLRRIEGLTTIPSGYEKIISVYRTVYTSRTKNIHMLLITDKDTMNLREDIVQRCEKYRPLKRNNKIFWDLTLKGTYQELVDYEKWFSKLLDDDVKYDGTLRAMMKQRVTERVIKDDDSEEVNEYEEDRNPFVLVNRIPQRDLKISHQNKAILVYDKCRFYWYGIRCPGILETIDEEEE